MFFTTLPNDDTEAFGRLWISMCCKDNFYPMNLPENYGSYGIFHAFALCMKSKFHAYKSRIIPM